MKIAVPLLSLVCLKNLSPISVLSELSKRSKCSECQLKLYLCFVDFRKAYMERSETISILWC